MRVRLATTRDLHRLTEITTSSLIDDPTYDYLNPHRLEYPEDNSTWMRLRLEKHLYDRRSTFLVVELDGSEIESNTSSLNTRGPASVIISYGIWVRMGDDAAAKGRFREKNTWLNALDCKSLSRAEFHFIFSVKLSVSHKRCAWKAFTDTRTPSHDSTSLPMVYKPKIYPTRCIAISPIRYR
jgi:hypothetical protein